VPKNEALVRQFGVFKTRAEAAAREQALIAQYGRKGIDDGGTLLNRTLGGDTGSLGYGLNKTAKKYGVPIEWYSALSPNERSRVAKRYMRGLRGPALMENVASEINPIIAKATQKYGVSPEWWESLTPMQKTIVSTRYRRGTRGTDLTKHIVPGGEAVNPQFVKAAEKLGVPIEWYSALSPTERQRIRQRYARGLRGSSLMENATSEINPVITKAAQKFEVPIEWYSALTSDQRTRVSVRYRRGARGSSLMENITSEVDSRLIKAAQKYGVSLSRWESLTPAARALVNSRYRQGKRGAALLEGLI
jgi:hypothetical protein